MVDILKRNIVNKMLKGMLILFFGIILGYLALVIVYMLPVERMEQHVRESQAMFEDEGIEPVLIEGYRTTRLDNYSDGLIMNSAIYDEGESVWKKAAAIYQYQYGGEDYYHSLLKYLDGVKDYDTGSYERDWHGYLVYVKPLLLCMNYADIRLLNMVTQIFIVCMLLYCMSKKNLAEYIPAFVMTLVFLTWNILFYSIEYSAMFYVFTIASLIAINRNEWIVGKNHIPEFFLIIGMVVSYIDVLTYPIVTIGIPLVFLFLLNREWMEKISSIIGNIATASFWWLCGYAGMWGGKWVIASVVLKGNVIKESILMALYRMSQTSGETGVVREFTISEVFALNFGIFMKPAYIVAIILFMVWVCVKAYKKRVNFKIKTILPFAIIALMPVVWYLLIGNHSYIHYWMTHRNIALLVFAIAAMLITMITEREKQ